MNKQKKQLTLLEWITKAFRALLRRFGISWVNAILIERDLIHLPLPEVKTKVPVEIAVGTSEHIDIIRGLFPNKWVESYEKWLDEGKIWLLAFVEGKVAYSTWITFDDHYEPNLQIWVRLSKGEAYFFNSYALPEFEGLGLHTFVTAKRLKIAQERGAQKALGIVIYENMAARRVMITKLAFYEKQYIKKIYIFKKSFQINRSFTK